MGMLRNTRDGRRVVLGARHPFGRSGASTTRLDTPGVSGEHAVLTWDGEAWELRDLASRNGTWLGGHRLDAGQRPRLAVGDSLAFGAPDELWTLESAAEPSAVAFCDGAAVEGDGMLLALPSFDEPEVVVELDPSRGWQLRREGEASPASDGQRLVIGARVFELCLPGVLAPTMPVDFSIQQLRSARRVSSVALEIGVSADEEYVELVVLLEGDGHPVPPEAHHDLLLVLARRRLEDRADDAAESEAGWVYSADLRKMLRVSANQHHVMAHRCRRELEALDVVDAAELLEKRTTSRQVRLGVEDLTVRSL